MKKITAIIMSALILTIGGVYATWTYAQGSVAQSNEYIKGQIKMATVVTDNAAGSIAIDLSDVSIIIDDTDATDTVGDHHANLQVSGTITITFTPNKGSSDVNGIPMRYQVSITDTSVTYPDATGTEKGIMTVANGDWININGGAPTLTYTFNASDLGLSLGGDFYLPTYEDFVAFRNKLNSFSVRIAVEEIPATPAA